MTSTWQFSGLTFVLLMCLATAAPAPQLIQQEPHALLDIETPSSFSYSSPLQQPDSLRSRPYFDFLSTLYRRDSTKSDLFRPYTTRTRRAAESVESVQPRPRRAIVFRPLFVYKQQEIRKQERQDRRRAGRV